VSQLSDDELAHKRSKFIGFIFQFHFLMEDFTAQENVMIPMRKLGQLSDSEMRERAAGLLEAVGLGDKLRRPSRHLSGGEQQRVAIARALANRPRILLMDEPFGALDAQTRAQMQAYLLQIWKQVDITIVFITHDLDEAVYLADRVLILDAHPGRLRELMEVAVPRPRRIEQFGTPVFAAARRHLEEIIHPPIDVAIEALPIRRMTVVGDDVE